ITIPPLKPRRISLSWKNSVNTRLCSRTFCLLNGAGVGGKYCFELSFAMYCLLPDEVLQFHPPAMSIINIQVRRFILTLRCGKNLAGLVPKALISCIFSVVIRIFAVNYGRNEDKLPEGKSKNTFSGEYQ